MSELTKQQLRNELVSHGVDLPSPTAKKNEYVKIYEKYVAPVARSKGDFSSDDEDLPVNDVRAPVSHPSLDTSQLVIRGLDVTRLDDEELYSRLQDLGSPVGPIVDTTREVYQKKLFVLMGGHVAESSAVNGDVDQEEEEEEYSDSEPDVNVNESSEMVFDPDLHTPSPRRSLRTVTSSTSETNVTYRRMFNNGKTLGTARYVSAGGKDVVDSTPSPGKVSSALRLLVKLLFLALLIAAALYFYQNNPTESPFKAIEEMARQALEAAAGEEGKAAPQDADHPAPPPPKQPEVAN
ncbi:Lamina-associated polypeptide 2, isoform beta [Chionoecetes opilio]|uniref:Lamina-associated polypeptide 2, isoform beta n=1 Tax=Chionoecetes opilio TaxID=41210 RepID=A0A8J4Y1W3_CHIOP|nr:Lamina-associated polypeptide 2, isoform beta [Chionoecetes opilio]